MSKTTERARSNDPAHYRELCTPFASVEKANEALHAFFADVEAARNKHMIPDVVVLAEIAHTMDGEELRGAASANFGDSNKAVLILAKAYGAEQARHEERCKLITAEARKRAVKP